MQDLLNKKKLEQILTARWVEFLSVPILLTQTQKLLVDHLSIPPNCFVSQIKLSRFEITDKGFALWLEAIVVHTGQSVNATLELFLSTDGNISYIDGFIDQTTST